MKVTMRDLDSNILEKLNVLDNVAKTYDEKHPDGFVSYGPNGFYFKKTNDTFLKKVFDENEIVSLEQSLHSNASNILSSELVDFRADNKTNIATKAFLFKTPFTYKKDLGSKILNYKSFDSVIYTLNYDGCLYKISEDSESTNVDILKILEENFNLAKKIYANDLLDFDILDADTVILATSNFGVYKVHVSKKEIELLFVAERVRKIKITYTKSLFVLTDDFCAQYDIATGNRIEKYSNIVNRHQLPLDAVRVNGDIFVLGTPIGISNLDNILHLWKLDEEKISYNCVDSKIERFHLDNRYQIMFIAYDEHCVYISGLFNDNPFVLSVDRNTLRVTKKFVYTSLTLNEYTDFRAIDGKFVILSKNMVYILNENSIEERLQLESDCSRIKILNGEVVAISGSNLVKFQLTKFSTASDSLLYNILNSDEPCNNLDILIKNVGRSERVTLIDGNTGKEIQASYYLLYKGNAVLKLMNCKSTNIILKLAVTVSSNVEGIVVRKNRMFLR